MWLTEKGTLMAACRHLPPSGKGAVVVYCLWVSFSQSHPVSNRAACSWSVADHVEAAVVPNVLSPVKFQFVLKFLALAVRVQKSQQTPSVVPNGIKWIGRISKRNVNIKVSGISLKIQYHFFFFVPSPSAILLPIAISRLRAFSLKSVGLLLMWDTAGPGRCPSIP